MDAINFYSRKIAYGFLSNFHRCVQTVTSEWGTYQYPTNEHWYQAMKANSKEFHDWIVATPSPFLAMKAGRSLCPNKELRDNWDSLKVEIMLKGLRVKFSDKDLRRKLLDTGDAILHEDSPTDMFWGKKGEDWLGKLLMQVREEIRKDETL